MSRKRQETFSGHILLRHRRELMRFLIQIMCWFGSKPIRMPRVQTRVASDLCHWAEAMPVILLSTGSDRLPGQRRKAKTDHLVEGWFKLLLKFHDQARMAEPDASGVDETCRKGRVSQRKLA